jgi:hypothetical protein
MNNPNDPADDGDQLETQVRDYRTLLKQTRPLVISDNTMLPLQSPIHRDQASSFEAGECHEESVLKRGEIVCPDPSDQTAPSDQGPAAAVDLPLTSSKLRIRIYIGMS